MAIVIRGTGKSIPQKRVTNDELDPSLGTSDEWIRSHTGIGSRYIAAEDETVSSLGAAACRKALERANADARADGRNEISIEDIEAVIVSTVTAEYAGFPSTGCLIQEKIGAVNAVGFDLLAACAGFIFGLDTAYSMMKSHGWKYAFVCSSETLSRIADWTDRSTCVLFGDGAGAVLLENTDATDAVPLKVTAQSTGTQYEQGLSSFIIGSDGTRSMALYTDKSGLLRMDGQGVYNFAVGIMTKTIRDLMDREKLSIDDVDLIVCHQANARILSASAKRLGFPIEKFVFNIEEYGNMSSACIPVTLDDLVHDGRLKKGMTIVSAGFGAGLTWAGCVIRF